MKSTDTHLRVTQEFFDGVRDEHDFSCPRDDQHEASHGFQHLEHNGENTFRRNFDPCIKQILKYKRNYLLSIRRYLSRNTRS